MRRGVAIVLISVGLGGCLLDSRGLGSAGPDADADLDADQDRDDGGPDSCVSGPELCNERDDDCDGLVDEGFELATDPSNCGSCGHACPTDPSNGASRCMGGECLLDCDPGFIDCDGVDDGCEASLADRSSCGGCGVRCVDPTPLCELDGAGSYRCVSSCSAGLQVCDGSCVDTDADVSHCGGCGRPCPAPPNASAACVGGVCGFTCDEGYGACSGVNALGCETSLRTETDCGGCGEPCSFAHAVASCETGSCVFEACEAGWATAPGAPLTGASGR